MPTWINSQSIVAPAPPTSSPSICITFWIDVARMFVLINPEFYSLEVLSFVRLIKSKFNETNYIDDENREQLQEETVPWLSAINSPGGIRGSHRRNLSRDVWVIVSIRKFLLNHFFLFSIFRNFSSNSFVSNPPKIFSININLFLFFSSSPSKSSRVTT